MFINRYIQEKILRALAVSPVVFLNGPRQAGKSTLVQALTITNGDYPAEYVTFDSVTQLVAATNSPEVFLKMRSGALIIDEVQLVPEIFRALKIVVDELRTNTPHLAKGKFLLTGSANIMALPKLADSLVGRMSVLTMYPLAAAEIARTKGDFIARLFNREFVTDPQTADLLSLMKTSTFPELVNLNSQERSIWFDSYITTILQRDVRALADIEKLSALLNLLRILASRTGSLLNESDLARDATKLSTTTTRNYKTLLKMLFLTFELAPWYRNLGKRLVKSAKGYVIDSLLLCHLLQYELCDLEQKRPELFGHVLENFVATELRKLLTFYAGNLELLHFRTSDQKEVDFVLEQPNGQLAAIEVKQSDTLTHNDFKGLVELQRLTTTDFICGIVLYRGSQVVPFGDRLYAVPISNLWL